MGGGGGGGGRACRVLFNPIPRTAKRLSNILMIPDPPLLALNWRSIFFYSPSSILCWQWPTSFLFYSENLMFPPPPPKKSSIPPKAKNNEWSIIYLQWERNLKIAFTSGVSMEIIYAEGWKHKTKTKTNKKKTKQTKERTTATCLPREKEKCYWI